MSLYQNSNDDLSAMISAAAGVTVTSSQYTIQAVAPTTASEQSGVAGGKNTKVSVLMNSGAPLSGSMTLYYDRLDLGALSNFQPYRLPGSPDVDVSTLLTQFCNMFGFTLTMNDIADATSYTASDGTIQVVLTALSTSLGFTGTFTAVFSGLPNISTAFMGTTMPGF